MAKETIDEIFVVLQSIVDETTPYLICSPEGLTKDPKEVKKIKASSLFDKLHCSARSTVEKCPKIESLIMSSPGSSKENEEPIDSRIRCGDLILCLFRQLTIAMKEHLSDPNRSEKDKMCYDLSLGHMSTLKKAWTIAFLAGALPYYPSGIGVPLQYRTRAITDWIPLNDDQSLQLKQLRSLTTVLYDLIESSPTIESLLSTGHAVDVFTCPILLDHLGYRSCFDRYEALVSRMKAYDVMSAFSRMISSNVVRQDINACRWFHMACGSRLSSEIIKPDGIRTYFALQGDFFNDNETDRRFDERLLFLQRLAKQFSRPPKAITRYEYFNNVIHQFFDVVLCKPKNDKDERLQASIIRTFTFFIDEVMKSYPQYGKDLIFDRIFKPWEEVLEEENRRTSPLRSESMCESLFILQLLFKWRRDIHGLPFCIIQSSRIIKCLPLWLMALNGDKLSRATTTKEKWAETLTEHLYELCYRVLAPIENKTEYLLSITSDYVSLKLVDFERKKIQVIDESRSSSSNLIYDGYLPSFTTIPIEKKSDMLRSIVDTFFKVFAKKDKKMLHKVIMEVFTECTLAWNTPDTAYTPRFIHDIIEENEDDDKYTYLMQYHVIAEVACSYTKNISFDEDCNEETIMDTLSLHQVYLMSILRNIEEEVGRQKYADGFDVVHVERMEEERKELIRITATNMGIVSNYLTILPTLVVMMDEGKEEMMNRLEDMRDEVEKVVKIFNELKEIPDQWNDAQEECIPAFKAFIVTIDNMTGKDRTPEHKEETIRKKKDNGLNIVRLRTLLDGLPFEKGHALIVLSRELKKRNEGIIKVVFDDGIYEIAYDLINDNDSYVYLNAVNMIAEAALVRTDKIASLVRAFTEMASTKETKGKGGEIKRTVIYEKVELRGKIATVICNVYEHLGTSAPQYLPLAISLILPCINDMDDIIRSCSYNTIGRLIMTSKGLGAEPYMTTILDSINNTLQMDKSTLTRRSASFFLLQVLKGPGKDIIENLYDNLRDINRLLNRVLEYERDEVVQDHCIASKETIRDLINQSFQNENEDRIGKITVL